VCRGNDKPSQRGEESVDHAHGVRNGNKITGALQKWHWEQQDIRKRSTSCLQFLYNILEFEIVDGVQGRPKKLTSKFI